MLITFFFLRGRLFLPLVPKGNVCPGKKSKENEIIENKRLPWIRNPDREPVITDNAAIRHLEQYAVWNQVPVALRVPGNGQEHKGEYNQESRREMNVPKMVGWRNLESLKESICREQKSNSQQPVV